MPTTTPRRIDETVRKFCRSLNRSVEPVFVDVRPGPDDRAVECFFNVRRRVEGEGGKLAYGWAIWFWDGVYIEAEHHGVWERPDGTLLDVTPRTAEWETRVLFVRDDSLTFDFERLQRRDNVRRSLTTDPMVSQFLEAATAWAAFRERHSQGRLITFKPQDAVPFFARYQALQIAMYRKYLRASSLCPCNSGRKVKKCCGFEKWISWPLRHEMTDVTRTVTERTL